MIVTSREGSKLSVCIKTDLPNGSGEKSPVAWMWFARDGGAAYQAELLQRYLDERLFKALQKIRREAYSKGWKDAKAKTRKSTHFAGSWSSRIVGY